MPIPGVLQHKEIKIKKRRNNTHKSVIGEPKERVIPLKLKCVKERVTSFINAAKRLSEMRSKT